MGKASGAYVLSGVSSSAAIKGGDWRGGNVYEGV
jgi:hypothetical protein